MDDLKEVKKELLDVILLVKETHMITQGNTKGISTLTADIKALVESSMRDDKELREMVMGLGESKIKFEEKFIAFVQTMDDKLSLKADKIGLLAEALEAKADKEDMSRLRSLVYRLLWAVAGGAVSLISFGGYELVKKVIGG